MKKVLFRYFIMMSLFLGYGSSFAHHIVGGEFEIEHILGFQYEIRLIQYRDAAQQENPYIDDEARVRIFRKRDNVPIQDFFLFKDKIERVKYTNPVCAIGELVTDKVTYSARLVMNPGVYGDVQGYYITWERCCRNGAIENIVNPVSTGHTYYLEFPPVIIDGKPFVNSTPKLFPPLSDYACKGKPFYFDFNGVDKDGDSLVYSLTEPLRGYSEADPYNPAPVPRPAPYPVVKWVSGIGVNNMVPGPVPLKIDQNGMLRVTPSKAGLFVFAILCDEYRGGKRIGRVQRDFQLLVLDNCDWEPPLLEVFDQQGNAYVEGEAVFIPLNGPRCITLRVKDEDSKWSRRGEELVRIKAEPIGFKASLTDLFQGATQKLLKGDDDFLEVEVCLPECPYVDGPFMIDFIAMDNACSKPLMDTVRVIFDLETIPNQSPYFVEPDVHQLHLSVNQGEEVNLLFVGQDDDGDELSLEMVPGNFNHEGMPISFAGLSKEAGKIEKRFIWDTDCRKNDYNKGLRYDFIFLLKDQGYCGLVKADTVKLRVDVGLPQNELPVVYTPQHEGKEVFIEAKIKEVLEFDVVADDPDTHEKVRLRAIGDRFNFNDYGVDFSSQTDFPSFSVPFRWPLTCDNISLSRRDSFSINFIVDDQDLCGIKNEDTLKVHIRVFPPDNQAPELHLPGHQHTELEYHIGEKIRLEFQGVDQDNDSLLLRLSHRPERRGLGYVFNSARGRGKVSSVFEWEPDCAILNRDFAPNTFMFTFKLSDEVCFNTKEDDLTLTITLSDKPSDFAQFKPPNIFTPNGDGYNDVFELKDHLPEDNCDNAFEFIKIYNRWGVPVFFSNQRHFSWDGSNVSEGVYYYFIFYQKHTFKSTLKLKR
jgi:gliding motility-associated-like protein